jgi:hypothetical protein
MQQIGIRLMRAVITGLCMAIPYWLVVALSESNHLHTATIEIFFWSACGGWVALGLLDNTEKSNV